MSWRLAAFYIEKHRQFGGEITINLGGNYFYQFEILSSEDLFIKRKRNNNFIDGFFGKNISNVSALVGANGTGKTSLFVELMNNKDALLVYEKDGKSSVIRNNYGSESTLKLTELDFKNDNSMVLELADLKKKSHLGINIGSNAYHSPKFSYFNPQSASNYFLSEIATVREEYKNPLELNALRLQRSLLMFSNQKLIGAIHKVYDDFPEYASAIISSNALSKELLWTVEIEISDLDKKKDEDKDSIGIRLMELRESEKYVEKVNFLSRFDNTDRDLRYNAISKLYVMARILSFSLLREKTTKERVTLEEPYLTNEELVFSDKNIQMWLIALRNRSNGFTNSDVLKRFIDLGLQWYALLPLNDEINLETLTTLINNKFLQKQQELNDLFFGSSDYVPFDILSRRIDFQLSALFPAYSLSQGEENLLNLLSSVYANDNFKENRPQILLLDEATSGFHPKWQKKFVNTIVKILPLIFEAKISRFENREMVPSSIQIVFTSHDPFPLSDLPRYCITYLYNNEITQVLKGIEADKKKSFGANITDLLEDSFFLGEGEGSLVGEFAQEKINNVIAWINCIFLLK